MKQNFLQFSTMNTDNNLSIFLQPPPQNSPIGTPVVTSGFSLNELDKNFKENLINAYQLLWEKASSLNVVSLDTASIAGLRNDLYFQKYLFCAVSIVKDWDEWVQIPSFPNNSFSEQCLEIIQSDLIALSSLLTEDLKTQYTILTHYIKTENVNPDYLFCFANDQVMFKALIDLILIDTSSEDVNMKIDQLSQEKEHKKRTLDELLDDEDRYNKKVCHSNLSTQVENAVYGNISESIFTMELDQ